MTNKLAYPIILIMALLIALGLFAIGRLTEPSEASHLDDFWAAATWVQPEDEHPNPNRECWILTDMATGPNSPFLMDCWDKPKVEKGEKNDD